MLDLIDYYEATPDSVIKTRIAERFQNPDALRLTKHFRNVVATVIDDSAILFEEAPTIEFVASKAQDVWDALWDELNLPAYLQAIDSYSLLCGTLLVRVDNEDGVSADGTPKVCLTLITPDELVVPTEATRKTRPLQYRIRRTIVDDDGFTLAASNMPFAQVPNVQNDRRRGMDTAIRLRRPPMTFLPGPGPQKSYTMKGATAIYDVFTLFHDGGPPVWTVENETGTKISDGPELQFDPFVVWHSSLPITEFFAPAPLDLLSAQNAITDHLIEYGHQMRLNAFSIPVISNFLVGGASVNAELSDGTGRTRPKLSLDPSRPLVKPVGDDGEEVAPLEYVSPGNVDVLKELRDKIASEAEDIKAKYGLTANQSSATSGFMLQVLSVPLLRRTQKRRTLAVPALRKLVVTLMRAKGYELTADEFTVSLSESRLPEDPSGSLAETQRVQLEIDMGLTSRVRELMRRDPDLDEEGAKKLAEEIDKENEEAKGPDPLAAMMANRGALLGSTMPPADPNAPVVPDPNAPNPADPNAGG